MRKSSQCSNSSKRCSESCHLCALFFLSPVEDHALSAALALVTPALVNGSTLDGLYYL